MIARIFIFLLVACLLLEATLASQAAGSETLVGIVGRDFILLGADSSVSSSISLTASNLDKIAPISEPFFYEDDDDSDQQCIVAAAAGDAAASDRLVSLLQAHATIEEYQAGWGCDVEYKGVSGDQLLVLQQSALDVEAMANFARAQIASALRSRSPFQVCLLIAGMTSVMEPEKDYENSPFEAQKVQQQLVNAWGATSAQTENKDKAKMDTELETEKSLLRPRLFWLDEYGSCQKLQYGAHGYGSNFLLSILDQGFKENMSLDEALSLLKECFSQLRTRYVINSPQPPCIKCVDANGIRIIR
jgi:20S proteasome alpha/beta subunit